MMMSPCCSSPASSFDGRLGDRAGGQHHPHGARRRELLDHLGEPPAPAAPSLASASIGGRVAVIDDGLMPGPHQPPADVAAHPSQADDPKLHACSSFTSPGDGPIIATLTQSRERAWSAVRAPLDQLVSAAAPPARPARDAPAAPAFRAPPTRRSRLAPAPPSRRRTCIFRPGTGKSLRVVGGDLQDHPAVGATLVRLAGRVQEARAEAHAGGDVLGVADAFAHAGSAPRWSPGCGRCRRAAQRNRRVRPGRTAP